jgi:hypothetical protein
MANKTLFWSFFVIFRAFYAFRRLPESLHALGRDPALLRLPGTVLSRQIRSLPNYQVGPRNLFTPLETCLLFRMGRYTQSLCAFAPLLLCPFVPAFGTFTTVERALQIRPFFLQNEPNFRKAQMNATCCLTTNYEQLIMNNVQKNKAKTNPIKANIKPIKANKMPKQTQYKAKQTQYEP